MGPPRSEHLLPPNSTALERAMSASDVRMLSVPHQVVRAVWSPTDCPAHMLPYLAAAWSVDEWDPAWTEQRQRSAIVDSVWLHRHKGAAGALRRGLEPFGFAVAIEEWFRFARAPYTFRLRVRLASGIGWTAAQSSRLYRLAMQHKNVRSFLDNIVVEQPAAALTMVSLGCAVAVRVRTSLIPDPVTSIVTPMTRVSCGAAVAVRQRWSIGPRA